MWSALKTECPTLTLHYHNYIISISLQICVIKTRGSLQFFYTGMPTPLHVRNKKLPDTLVQVYWQLEVFFHLFYCTKSVIISHRLQTFSFPVDQFSLYFAANTGRVVQKHHSCNSNTVSSLSKTRLLTEWKKTGNILEV